MAGKTDPDTLKNFITTVFEFDPGYSLLSNSIPQLKKEQLLLRLTGKIYVHLISPICIMI